MAQASINQGEVAFRKFKLICEDVQGVLETQEMVHTYMLVNISCLHIRQMISGRPRIVSPLILYRDFSTRFRQIRHIISPHDGNAAYFFN